MAERGPSPVERSEWLTLALIVVAGVTLCVRLAVEQQGWTVVGYQTNITDPLLFRIVGELLLAGQLPYDDAVRSAWISETRLSGAEPPYSIPFAYPPTALPLFALRGLGPPGLNFALHVGLGALAFLLASVWLATRWLPKSSQRLVAVVGAAVMPVAMFDGLLGQTGHMVGTLAIGALGGPLLSGVCVGLLMFKPQYGAALAVALLARGEKLAAATAAGVAALIVLLTTAWLGASAWREFLAAAAAPNPTLPYMANWVSSVAALGVDTSRLSVWGLAVFAVGIGVIVIVVRAIPERHEALAAVLALTWVISPNTHPYDLCLAVVPIVALAARTAGAVPLVVLIVAQVALAWPLLSRHRWAFALVGAALFLGLLVTARAPSSVGAREELPAG